MKELKTITEVGKMLDMTSRTIRYYEQCRLIHTIRTSNTSPRRLDSENIERLRRIRFLRKLGLSLDEIASVIGSETKTAEMIYRKNEEFKAEINALTERIYLLEEVLDAAEQGKNIYEIEPMFRQPSDNTESFRIAVECTKLILEGRFSELKKYLNADMRRLPPEFFETAWKAHIESCGKFISVGEQTLDGNTVINRLDFEKLGVIIRTDIYGEMVVGVVLQHFKLKKGEKS
ncbi:MAG: MerR family transcriptional regulator [Oscillospiraceae bacterium]|nr:MerR family transcriptional regulator [Oscillospiraceae bacterium]